MKNINYHVTLGPKYVFRSINVYWIYRKTCEAQVLDTDSINICYVQFLHTVHNIKLYFMPEWIRKALICCAVAFDNFVQYMRHLFTSYCNLTRLFSTFSNYPPTHLLFERAVILGFSGTLTRHNVRDIINAYWILFFCGFSRSPSPPLLRVILRDPPVEYHWRHIYSEPLRRLKVDYPWSLNRFTIWEWIGDVFESSGFGFHFSPW